MPRSSSEAPESLDPGLSTGLSAGVSMAVTDADTAPALGTGDVAVVGTPRLVALCEEASYRAIVGHLGRGRTTVASRIQFDHLAPVAVGNTVTADATLERVEGRRLVFTVSVRLRSDARACLVGAGRLTRVLVDKEKFLAKAGGEAGGSPERTQAG
jgi:predicted thioesterase